MADDPDCREHPPHLPASRQLGVGDYVGRVARSAALATCHLSTVIHTAPRKLPGHAHDWPYVGTLLRGSYVSRTRTREMEFEHGVAVFHPRAFQHDDEIGRDGGMFFGVQLNPDLLLGADRCGSDAGRDVAILTMARPISFLARSMPRCAPAPANLCLSPWPRSLRAAWWPRSR